MTSTQQTSSNEVNHKAPLVGVVMGSNSDWEVMQHAVEILKSFGIAYEARVVSAHRMPDDMFAYADSALSRGLRAIIAGAGGAAHLPGMLAAKTIVPVLGVPVPSRYLRGEDSLLSIVQMPKGIPVATFAIGEAGAANAALTAVAMLAMQQPELAERPDIAAKIAIWYWQTRVKPHVNNFNDTRAVTQKINPAMRGLQDRHAKFIDYKNIL